MADDQSVIYQIDKYEWQAERGGMVDRATGNTPVLIRPRTMEAMRDRYRMARRGLSRPLVRVQPLNNERRCQSRSSNPRR